MKDEETLKREGQGSMDHHITHVGGVAFMCYTIFKLLKDKTRFEILDPLQPDVTFK